MAYAVKEIFYTLQGEGRQAGRPAVFCRFAGCNLWTGREADRKSAVCQFCDTDFVGTDGPGGGKFATADDLAGAIAAAWPADDPAGRRFVVCTGGEPTLQLDEAVIAAIHARDFEIAVESNGTLPMPAGIDWICISPKAGTTLAQTSGNELKLVFPQPGAEPERFADLAFDHLLLQPMDGPIREANTQAALAYCLAHPRWSLSLQTHSFSVSHEPGMNGYSDDINHAFAFAAKYRAPYAPVEGAMTFLAHPANVAVILARHGADEVTLVAGILHHVLEVTPRQHHVDIRAMIEDKFGVAVLALARDAFEPLDDDRGTPLPWIQRKRALLHRLMVMAPRAIDVCCADQIHECGTSLAIVERLGGEYLPLHGLPSTSPELCCYDDILAALERRTDWHGRGMKHELHSLKVRLEAALADDA